MGDQDHFSGAEDEFLDEIIRPGVASTAFSVEQDVGLGYSRKDGSRPGNSSHELDDWIHGSQDKDVPSKSDDDDAARMTSYMSSTGDFAQEIGGNRRRYVSSHDNSEQAPRDDLERDALVYPESIGRRHSITISSRRSSCSLLDRSDNETNNPRSNSICGEHCTGLTESANLAQSESEQHDSEANAPRNNQNVSICEDQDALESNSNDASLLDPEPRRSIPILDIDSFRERLSQLRQCVVHINAAPQNSFSSAKQARMIVRQMEQELQESISPTRVLPTVPSSRVERLKMQRDQARRDLAAARSKVDSLTQEIQQRDYAEQHQLEVQQLRAQVRQLRLELDHSDDCNQFMREYVQEAFEQSRRFDTQAMSPQRSPEPSSPQRSVPYIESERARADQQRIAELVNAQSQLREDNRTLRTQLRQCQDTLEQLQRSNQRKAQSQQKVVQSTGISSYIEALLALCPPEQQEVAREQTEAIERCFSESKIRQQQDCSRTRLQCQQETQRLQQEVDALRQRLLTTEMQLKKAKQKLQGEGAQSRRIADLEGQVQDTQTAATQAQREVARLMNKISHMQNEVREANERNFTSQHLLSESRARITQLENQLRQEVHCRQFAETTQRNLQLQLRGTMRAESASEQGPSGDDHRPSSAAGLLRENQQLRTECENLRRRLLRQVPGKDSRPCVATRHPQGTHSPQGSRQVSVADLLNDCVPDLSDDDEYQPYFVSPSANGHPGSSVHDAPGDALFGSDDIAQYEAVNGRDVLANQNTLLEDEDTISDYHPQESIETEN